MKNAPSKKNNSTASTPATLTYSQKEAAHLLGVCEMTISRAIKAGDLVHVRIHQGSVRILKTDLEAYIKAHRFVGR
jgi:excisionase family DNA binding protein